MLDGAAAAVPARAQAAPAPTDADPDPSALAVVEGKAVEAMEVVLKAAPSAAEMEEAVHKAEHEAAVQVRRSRSVQGFRGWLVG